MLKNLILTAIVFSFPVFANAWTFPVSVTNTTAGINAGNKITVTIAGNSTDVTAGTKYFYPANTVSTVSVAIANLGNVTAITLDNVPQSVTSPVVVTKGSASLHSLSIVYSPTVIQKRNVTLAQAEGGLASLHLGTSAVSTTGFTDVAVGTLVDVEAQPQTGYKLKSIRINGVEKVVDAASGLGSTVPVTKSFQVDSAFSPNTVSSGYELIPQITATLSVPASAITATPVQAVVNAVSNVTPLNYDFSTTCSADTQNGTSSTFQFTPTAVGTCSVSVTVSGPGGSAATVSTAPLSVTSSVAADNYACLSCHASSTPVPVSLYNGSPHANVRSCQDCHTPSPHSALPSGNICQNCHADSTGTVPGHPAEIDGKICTTCHDPHSTAASTVSGPPHYNNITSGMYPASYVTSRAKCGNCHQPDTTNATIRHQWAQSDHAATSDYPWMQDDFKTMPGCVQCHTTTGFIAYSTGKVTAAWGVTSDKTKEVLACIGCHQDVPTGALRAVNPVSPYADDSYTNRNMGKSNLCMNCHSGRKNGRSILAKLAAQADFTDIDFIEPHYLAAGGTLHGRGGYEFSGRTYAFYSSNSHRTIGMGNLMGTGTAGPCITCHKNGNGHTFRIAGNGALPDVCADCHRTSLTYDNLSTTRSGFANALAILKAQLEASGHPYSAQSRTFTNRNWGVDRTGADTMGAALNYALLLAEPGAYVHNAAYSKRLIFDSVDYLYNGSITGSIDEALASLTRSGTITQAQADNLSTYRNGIGCKSCHGTLSGAHAIHVGDLIDSVSAYGDDGNYSTMATYRFGCGNCHPLDPSRHCNGVVDVELYNPAAGGFKINNPFAAGRTGSAAATVCLNTYCHSSGQVADVRSYPATPAWGDSFTGNRCAGCHADPPAYASGGAGSASANSHYTQSWSAGQIVEGGHLVGLHFDNIKVDPPYPWGGLYPKAGGSGSGAGHGDPATSTTISCPTCHAATVSAPSMNSAPYTTFSCASCHGTRPAPAIADNSRHVNGSRDVAFMSDTFRSRAQVRMGTFTSVVRPLGWTRNGYKTYTSFDSIPFSGSYNPAGKGCTTVCHFNQRVRWGDTEVTCISCHTDL